MRVEVLFSLYAGLLSLFPLFLAKDILNIGDKIIGNEITLVSAGNMFEMGFFSFNGSSNSGNSYLGIWYYGREPPTYVWVANRDDPVVNSTGVFQISQDGNLMVSDKDGKTYWSSGLPKSTPTNITLRLMDSGNFILSDNQSELWQSFDHPTDTFLAGMKMKEGFELISWTDSDDPRSGDFTFTLQDKRYIILRNRKVYWLSEIIGSSNSEETIPSVIVDLLKNFNMSNKSCSGKVAISNKFCSGKVAYDTRLVMNSTGYMQRWESWDEKSSKWLRTWSKPADQCDMYNACGNFSRCNINNTAFCNCLTGFNPRSPEDWFRKEFSGGCIRKTESCGLDNKFLDAKMIKVADADSHVTVSNEAECRFVCLNKCPECLAYSYDAGKSDQLRSGNQTPTCSMWSQDLPTLREEHAEGGRSISVRVEISDRASIVRRACEPCGLYIIPYPLSTEPYCGDPIYLKFKCDYSTGQLSFNTSMGSKRVTSIDSQGRTLSIEVKGRYCDSSVPRDNDLGVESPFNVAEWCFGENEVKVSWQPPPEPPCSMSVDCNDWTHSTCAGDEGGKMCRCDTNYNWDAANLACVQNVAIRSPGPEGPRTSGENSKSSLSLILVLTFASIIVIACLLISAFLWRKKISNRQDRLHVRGRMFDSERHVKDLIDLRGLEENDNEGIEVPYYDFEIILAATNNFSDANKLGKGGYGPVYKGKLPEGHDIAVKRLSNVSSQGLQEFKNEVVLIAKLQHRNLVKLRGYCIKGDEKILLYEYMPNKSLDAFIFDPTKSVLLDWKMRFDIILGVARGLLYLHHDSRLRIIHRDFKTSNILLDEEMNPKISDFGLARIVGGKETEANTDKVVGTYGYISPEYALDGLFSIKSDVFSFGVVLLEIVSGRKNSGFYMSKQFSSLLGYAWRLRAENKLLDLMDPCLHENCNTNQFMKCVNIGLLCVQDEPADRPTMSSVVTMLDGEIVSLPNPKQPTFFMSRGLSSAASSSSKPEMSMQFQGSSQEGR